MKFFQIALICLILTFTSSCSSSKSMIDKTLVKDFEIEKYLGTWYEIARYDHRFERDLVGVTAKYSWRDDGKIKVENSGFNKTLDGEKSTSTGKAKIPDNTRPAHLKVSFFWFFYADYYVLELDEDYQWAVVGSSSDKYLWILSRTPTIDEDLKKDILNKISNRGYDIHELLWVEQKK
jgi:apolipoprotein D and lipocalin family protein